MIVFAHTLKKRLDCRLSIVGYTVNHWVRKFQSDPVTTSVNAVQFPLLWPPLTAPKLWQIQTFGRFNSKPLGIGLTRLYSCFLVCNSSWYMHGSIKSRVWTDTHGREKDRLATCCWMESICVRLHWIHTTNMVLSWCYIQYVHGIYLFSSRIVLLHRGVKKKEFSDSRGLGNTSKCHFHGNYANNSRSNSLSIHWIPRIFTDRAVRQWHLSICLIRLNTAYHWFHPTCVRITLRVKTSTSGRSEHYLRPSYTNMAVGKVLSFQNKHWNVCQPVIRSRPTRS